ncbi:hypothetical protein [Sphingobacterium griseoflavum]|uniref:Uncharacterized protein n=1 Tax=Sphingobacterium griseoflavum TaxID=1474952 RepID=A0ABQ3HU85_9SPHI|nr:hypothetical protein [Sphingobacterium griseoflavum]GHE34969.1 hypothetical protein GCM10017764_17690 [Sphingobacterium griseoflavum]
MELKEQPNQPAKQPTFLQIVKHPVTYALMVVVSVFWFVLYYIADSKDNQLDREGVLYERIIEEVRKQNKQEISDQIKPIAAKVDTIKEKADSTFKNINDKLP